MTLVFLILAKREEMKKRFFMEYRVWDLIFRFHRPVDIDIDEPKWIFSVQNINSANLEKEEYERIEFRH